MPGAVSASPSWQHTKVVADHLHAGPGTTRRHTGRSAAHHDQAAGIGDWVAATGLSAISFTALRASMVVVTPVAHALRSEQIASQARLLNEVEGFGVLVRPNHVLPGAVASYQ
jgi:hypothetical protein